MQEIRTAEYAKAYAKVSIRTFGWNMQQFVCLEKLWTKESNWRADAFNRTPVRQNGKKLHAGGIPQILGLDPKTHIFEQINKGLVYIESRYSAPCKALAFHERRNWY